MKFIYLFLFYLCYTIFYAQGFYQVQYLHFENDYDFESEFMFNDEEAFYLVKEDREAGFIFNEETLRGVQVYDDPIYKATFSNSEYSIERIRLLGELMHTKRKDTIRWDIDLTQEKNILGFNCNLATTSYYGRSYTVWFTFDIPTLYSPYNFNGLPGLILKMHDNFGEFSIEAYKVTHHNTELLKNHFFLELKNIIFQDETLFKSKEEYDKETIKKIKDHENYKLAKIKEKYPNVTIESNNETIIRRKLLLIPKVNK